MNTELIIKILILLNLIIFVGLYFTMGYNHCDKCDFNIENKDLTMVRFIDHYESVCFADPTDPYEYPTLS